MEMHFLRVPPEALLPKPEAAPIRIRISGACLRTGGIVALAMIEKDPRVDLQVCAPGKTLYRRHPHCISPRHYWPAGSLLGGSLRFQR